MFEREKFDDFLLSSTHPVGKHKFRWSGRVGAVVDILPDGTLVVDVVNEDGSTVDMVDLDPGPPLRVVGRWHLGED